MATRIGLEPTTPSVTGWCSNQLSYRAMIAQVRAASYRGNVLYYIGKSACCQAQICEKSNFLQKRAQTRCFGGSRTILNGLRCCSGHIQRKIILNFAFVALCGALQTHFSREGS